MDIQNKVLNIGSSAPDKVNLFENCISILAGINQSRIYIRRLRNSTPQSALNLSMSGMTWLMKKQDTME